MFPQAGVAINPDRSRPVAGGIVPAGLNPSRASIGVPTYGVPRSWTHWRIPPPGFPPH